jgi:hypothetical protein
MKSDQTNREIAMNAKTCTVALLILFPFSGCFGKYEVHAPPPAAKTESAQQPGPPKVPSPGPAGTASPPSAASAGQSLPIRLSAGVALPQTLPDGTVMSFSIDYQFTQGQPDPAAGYFWVIERSQGPALRQPVKLSAQGTLPAIVPDFRPEQGPFQTYLEDARGVRLSATVPLR